MSTEGKEVGVGSHITCIKLSVDPISQEIDVFENPGNKTARCMDRMLIHFANLHCRVAFLRG